MQLLLFAKNILIGIETAHDVVIQTIGKNPISIEHSENVSLYNLEARKHPKIHL